MVSCFVIGCMPTATPPLVNKVDDQFSDDEGETATLDLPFAEVGGQPLYLDLYRPPAGRGPWPIVIYIHGGGWQFGNRKQIPPGVTSLIDEGIVVASIEYRQTTEAGVWGDAGVVWPAQIHAVKAAVRWIRGNANRYRLDSSRIAAWGDSAGGHLALVLALSGGDQQLEGNVGSFLQHSSEIMAAVNFAGAVEYERWDDVLSLTPLPSDVFSGYLEPHAGIARLLDWSGPGQGLGDLFENWANPTAPYPGLIARLRQIDLLPHADWLDPPVLLVHALSDRVVPYGSSAFLFDELNRIDVQCQLVSVPGSDHVPSLAVESDLQKDVYSWLRDRLAITEAGQQQR